jgi:putative NADH-flavin reductase
MRLTIFGATGGTGTCLVQQALAAGHEVTAVVRDPGRLAVPANPRLHAVTADVLDPASIVTSVAGADAVVSAIGPRDSGRTTISRDSAQSIIQAMQKAGTRRLITVSGSVVADEGDGPVLRYLLKPLARATQLRHVCADMRQAETEVQNSQLDWTIMRPPRLTDRPATGRYRTAVDRNPPRAFSLPRADLAAYILGVLSDQSTVHQHIGIAS